MQADAQIKTGLTIEPVGKGVDFGCFAIKKISIQIALLMILARADLQTSRIDDGAEKPIGALIEEASPNE